MDRDFTIDNITDAFLALQQIDDDEALSMLKVKDVRKLQEGRAFSLTNFNTKDVQEAKEFLDNDKKEETEIEVIDADADAVEHLKNKEDYVGQVILQCNKCKANRFIDADKLVVDPDDNELYNTEDECPYCKSEGSGYELIGQVGKVDNESEEEAPAEDSLTDEPAEEVALDNDAADEEEVKFDNDLEEPAPEEGAEEVETATIAQEPEEKAEPEEPKKLKLRLKKKFDDDEDEFDGMETSVPDDTELLDLPDLGEEYREEFNDVDDKEVSEAFMSAANINEEEGNNPYAHEAWMMNKVISSMNNEEAYYNSWLYVWPDGESREECEYDFGDKESFEDLKSEFISTYKYYHDDDLYNADEETEAYAHKWDEILELSPINNIKPYIKETLSEEADEENEEEADEEKPALTVGSFFGLVIDPEKMEQIDVNGFEGTYDEMPEELFALELTSFNVGDGHLVINVESAEEDEEAILVGDLVSKFDNEETENISLVDAESFEDVYAGNKAGALDKFADYKIVSIEKPEIIIMIGVDEETEAEAEAPVDESLFEQICRENNLYAYKAKRYNTEEYWLKENLDSEENLEEVYNNYCVNEDLRSKFKAQFNFKDASDNLLTIKENLITNENCAVVCGYRNNNKPYILEDATYVNTKAQLDTAIEKVCHDYMVNKDNVIVEYYPATKAYYVTVGKGYWNSTKQDAVADLDNATIYINEDKAAKDCKYAYQWFNSSCNVVCMESTFDKSALFEGMVNAVKQKLTEDFAQEFDPEFKDPDDIEEFSESVDESWNKEQIEKITKFGEALGLTKAADIYKFADDRGIDKNDGDALVAALEAELESIAAEEESDAHVVATGESGQTYVSVDGGKTWEQCSQEEYDELLAGGYKEGTIDEGLLGGLLSKIIPTPSIPGLGEEKETKFEKPLNESIYEDHPELDWELVDKIAERYCTSTPVSGDWDTEATHERDAIAKELDISVELANQIMIDYLGFDPEDLWVAEVEVSDEEPYEPQLTEDPMNAGQWYESCNTRKELKELIEKFKNNNKPYIVSRSIKEGYRWDIKEALDEAKEVEIVKHPVDEFIKAIGANDGDYDFEEGKAKFIYTDKDEESAQVGIELENGLFAVVGLNDDHLCDSYDDMVKCIKAYMNECINEAEEKAVDAPVGEIVKNAEIELPLEKIDIISKINTVAKTICDTIKNRYNLEVAPVAVIADVLQDLGLLDEDIDISNLEDSEIYSLTPDMFDEYKAGYILVNAVLYELAGTTFEALDAEALDKAMEMLDGDDFKKENIEDAIASDKFIEAVKAGEIKYLSADKADELEEALVKNSPLNVNIDLGNFGGEGNDVGVMNTELGDLGESLLDIFKAVCKKPLKEDNELVPTEEPVEAEVLESEDVRLAENVGRIARDICEAIEHYYGIEADYDLVVADILRDINLVSGRIDPSTLDDNNLVDRVTKEMYNDYEAMYDFIDALVSALTGQDIHSTREDKRTAALNALESDNFSTETIFAGIGSDRFIEAARRGAIPFIGREQALALEAPADEALIKDSPVNINIDAHEFGGKNNVVDVMNGNLGEEVEVNTDLFDKELNEYFNENYEETIVYITEQGSINQQGQIILEGTIKNETAERKVKFTLTPMQPLTEALETQEDVAKALGCTEFKVENDLSEEVFKFDFKNDTPNEEIFKFKEEEKLAILDKFIKDCKDCQKYMNAMEVVNAAAEMYYCENKAECDKLGLDICHVANQLATVVDQIDLVPVINNAEPKKEK